VVSSTLVTAEDISPEVEEGQRLLSRLAEMEFPVEAAFWAKNGQESDRRSLVLVTPRVAEAGSLSTYRQVIEAMRDVGAVFLTSTDVRVAGDADPLGNEVRRFQKHFPEVTKPRDRLPLVEYVYPLHEVRLTLYGLVFDGLNDAMHLSFEPHRSPTWMEVQEAGASPVRHDGRTGYDSEIAAPQGSRLERDENGTLKLSWEFRGKRIRSSPNEVWSLANLGLHGFRSLRDKSPAHN